MSTELSSVSDREIVITRRIHAPRPMVFQAFTDPEQLAQWWGPKGFTITTHVMEFRVGGRWDFVMHGPDGTDFPNRIEYIELTEPERIVMEHGGNVPEREVDFTCTVTLDEIEGDTLVTLRHLFPTVEVRDFVVEHYNAVEGGHQTLGRLATLLKERLDKMLSGQQGG